MNALLHILLTYAAWIAASLLTLGLVLGVNGLWVRLRYGRRREHGARPPR